MSNNSNFAAKRCRDAVVHTTPTPTVCYSVPSIVEVSGGCQSVNIMSAQPRDYCSEIICILRKIHRLRKHPWISAQTMDDNGSIDCAGRSMDCADPQIAPNITTGQWVSRVVGNVHDHMILCHMVLTRDPVMTIFGELLY